MLIYLVGAIITGAIIYTIQEKEIIELNSMFKIPVYSIDLKILFIRSIFFPITWTYAGFIFTVARLFELIKKDK